MVDVLPGGEKVDGSSSVHAQALLGRGALGQPIASVLQHQQITLQVGEEAGSIVQSTYNTYNTVYGSRSRYIPVLNLFQYQNIVLTLIV